VEEVREKAHHLGQKVENMRRDNSALMNMAKLTKEGREALALLDEVRQFMQEVAEA
jgi:hypothetical protein